MPDLRDDFPLLQTLVKSHPLIYFDNAASTQKPQSVIDSLNHYYRHLNSNIHRGSHYLANLATESFEEARSKISNFIGAKPHEIIFTLGTTHSINLLAYGWGKVNLSANDEVILTEMEHHANIVPWLALQKEIGFKIRYIPMNENCELDIRSIDNLFNSNTKLISLAYISNAMGTVHPIENIISKAKANKTFVHLDCAQAIQHRPLNMHNLNIDFLSFSSHKMYGPMGIGVFWGKESLLHQMNPIMYGGEMIREVHLDHFTLNELPFKFEAGTPNVADVIGLGAAVDYINRIGIHSIQKKEDELQSYFRNEILKIPGLILYTPENSTSVISFNVKGIHAYDIGQMLDAKGIAIRTGHHCCQPLMRKLGIEGTCRASLSFYNTHQEIDYFISSLIQIKSILS